VRRHTPFIKPAAWKACGGKPIIPDGAKVFAALDLGSTRDMSALVLIHEDANDVFHVVPYFWLPGEVHEQQEQDRAPYEEWIAKEYVTAIGEATDPKIIALKIAELNGRYQIRTLAFDRWRIADLQRELKAIGCSVPLVPHGQGYRDMSPAVDILERLIVQQRIRHGSHPVLAWNAVNAVVTQDPAKNRKLDKSKSGGKIDGIVALAMAFSIAMIKVEPEVDVAALIG
jgi:phage terminase large subunit-like protein